MKAQIINLSSTPDLLDAQNCRQYAFEENTKNCFVIIDNGSGMTSWGLPRYSVFYASKPFAEPETPLSHHLDWTLNGVSSSEITF
ncbi:hypothetical protein [Photobacterium damselae]|uniref:hypothetical protein n=1 Tax=Photobacterium damselae TaxID=38293 RepID=UPI0040690E26